MTLDHVVKLQVAEEIRVLGFNRPCYCVFKKIGLGAQWPRVVMPTPTQYSWGEGVIPAPTYQQIFDWAYDQYGLFVTPELNPINQKFVLHYTLIKDLTGGTCGASDNPKDCLELGMPTILQLLRLAQRGMI